VAQRQAAFVEGHADGNLAAVVALLFVSAVAGLGVLRAEALEVGVGDVVEDDVAAAAEESGLGVAQGRCDEFELGEKGVTGVVEAVSGGFWRFWSRITN
jgi:protein involved in polysaccharide export with SLBB domain